MRRFGVFFFCVVFLLLGEICYNMFYDIFGPRSGDAGV